VKADFPTPEAFEHAAWFLMCEANALRAVAVVEAGPLGGFNDDGTPVILFERHKFDAWTKGQFRGRRVPGLPDAVSVISSPVRDRKTYGASSIQHTKLAFAATLDREAALKSASWGLFQILGENHLAAGFPELQDFINAMVRDVDGHLRALVMFIRNNRRLLTAVRSRDWPIVALHYNGPKFKENQYDTKMATAYEKLA